MLGELINYANHYITEHGVAFNAAQTRCVIYGKCYFKQPKWFLNGTESKFDDKIKYLGAIFSKKHHIHQQERLNAPGKAFYLLQGSGICADGLRAEVASHLWKAMSNLHCILPLSKSYIMELDKLQAKLMKGALGFTKYYIPVKCYVSQQHCKSEKFIHFWYILYILVLCNIIGMWVYMYISMYCKLVCIYNMYVYVCVLYMWCMHIYMHVSVCISMGMIICMRMCKYMHMSALLLN